MIIRNYLDKAPVLRGCYVADDVSVIGDVIVEKDASVWYGTVLRGDVEQIVIGENTSIQDNCTVHCAINYPTVIGKNCVVGHNAILHSCIVEDDCLIGMGAILLDGCHIGRGSIVAAGAVVSPRKVIPPDSMVMGVPGRITRTVTPEDQKETAWSVQHYLSYAENQLTRLED